ncbi:hypothetical protein ACQBAU_16145 [Propionibacteriaceae bacterium Y2011]
MKRFTVYRHKVLPDVFVPHPWVVVERRVGRPPIHRYYPTHQLALKHVTARLNIRPTRKDTST